MVTHRSRYPLKHNANALKNKHALITCGSVWTPIDSVRIISNRASGQTGRLIKESLLGEGAKVNILSGPMSFRKLQDALRKELKSKKIDIVIHSAAVCDYRPRNITKAKVSSGLKPWRLELLPTPKIINSIKDISPGIFLVGFKFEPQAGKKKILSEATALIRSARADLVVANTCLGKKGYQAYIVGPQMRPDGPYRDKRAMVSGLMKILRNSFLKKQKKA